MKKKRPRRKMQATPLELTRNTGLDEIFALNPEKTRQIIKQMEAYGVCTIGYGIDYTNTLHQHAREQSLTAAQFKNLLQSINRKL